MATKKKTSFKKRIELEEKFARYMKDELKYDKLRVRAHIPLMSKANGVHVDILARKYKPIKEAITQLNRGFIITGLFLLVLGLVRGV